MIQKILSLFFHNEILRKSSVSLFIRVFGSIMGYIFLVLVTRNIGASSWGVFILFLSILNIFSIFSRLGVDMLALKLVSSANYMLDKIKTIYFSSFRIVLVSSCVVSIIVYTFSKQISLTLLGDIKFDIIVRLMSFVLPLFSIICINERVLQGLKMIKEFTFFQSASKMLFSSLFFLLFYYYLDIPEFYVVVLSYLAALFLIFIISSFKVYKIIKEGNFLISLKVKDIFSQSLPMMISSSVLLLMSWVDSLMIGGFSSEYDVGLYSVAVKVSFLTSFTLYAVNSISAPKISESFNNNNKSLFKNIIYQTTRTIFYSTMPIVIIIFIFPELLLGFFGLEFVAAKKTLLILAFSQVINAMSGANGSVLNMTGKEKVFRNILSIALVINITLNLLLIPSYGIEGAAIASATSLIFWNLYSVLYIYKEYGVLTFISFRDK